MANENIITQRKNSSKKTQNVSSRRKKKLRRSGVLTMGFKSSIYRLKVRVSSQLRTPTHAATRIARETMIIQGGLAAARHTHRSCEGHETFLECFGQSFFHIHLCLLQPIPLWSAHH